MRYNYVKIETVPMQYISKEEFNLLKFHSLVCLNDYFMMYRKCSLPSIKLKHLSDSKTFLREKKKSTDFSCNVEAHH